jgi:hypothetical protein
MNSLRMPPRVSRQYTKTPHRIQVYSGGGGAQGGRAASTALSAAPGQGGDVRGIFGFAFDCRMLSFGSLLYAVLCWNVNQFRHQ